MHSLLYPETQSPKELAVPFTSCKINMKDLRDAQSLFKQAIKLGLCDESEKMVNKANYLLIGAYMGGAENDLFWEQF